MSFEFETVAAELEAYLKPLLPSEWLVQDAFKTMRRTTKVTLTYAQGNADTKVDGTSMPNGTVAVEFALILRTPETDGTKGWPRLNAAAPHLFRALDTHAQILWETAEAGVQDSGESIYAIAIHVLVTYPDPTP